MCLPCCCADDGDDDGCDVVRTQDGKAAGWHDYETAASDIVEDVYDQWQSDPTLNVRCVQVSLDSSCSAPLMLCWPSPADARTCRVALGCTRWTSTP